MYLSNYLRKTIEDVEIFYLDSHLGLKNHMKMVEKINPDMYGISFSSLRFEEARTVTSAVKERFPSLPVVCGGAHPTIAPEEVLNEMSVDICVVGEGEETLSEVVEAVCLGRRKLEEVNGIVYRGDNEVIRNPKRPFIKDLDSIPFPAWDLVDFRNYVGNYQYKKKPSTAIIVSRGCQYNCTFCSNPVWKSNKPWLRLRSPKNIAEEISILYKRGIREISIRSDEFNVRLDWCVEVCKEIQKLGYKDMYFQANFRAHPFSEELAQEMVKSNFWLIQLGIESANQRVLDGINKKTTIEQISNTCSIAKHFNIKVYAYIMIYNVWEENGKLCYETTEEVNNTFSFVRRLKSKGLLHFMSFSTSTPLRGSVLYDIANKHNILKYKSDPKDLSEFIMNLGNIPEKEMKRIRFKGMLIQLYCILSSPGTSWAVWRKILFKIKSLFNSFFLIY
ncbi:MAG: B12-binding domain-containing radical SAM protein [Candidatus Aminicenantes bacterium]|nr:MAG: B12-binding domain-containing radical SAM protein [Candidatus Aminicenantes bacterium]